MREDGVHRTMSSRRLMVTLVVWLAIAVGCADLIEEQRWLAIIALFVLGVSATGMLLIRQLPKGVDLLLASAIVFLAAGMALTLFRRFDLFDILMHAYISLALACSLGFLIRPLLPESTPFRPVAVVPILILVTLSPSMLWEIWQAATGMRARWGDTSLDLLCNAIGAAAGAMLYRRLEAHSARRQGPLFEESLR